MKVALGSNPAVYPMPVLMVATYSQDGKVDVMNAAWGTISKQDRIVLNLSERHKTVENLKKTKAFTVSLADKKNIKQADFFGIASGNNIEDKFERSGLTAVKSERVNAPVIQEFPITMECELLEIVETENIYATIGKILNVIADDSVLDSAGKVDISKADLLIFDQFKGDYYVNPEKAGKAWSEGKELMM